MSLYGLLADADTLIEVVQTHSLAVLAGNQKSDSCEPSFFLCQPVHFFCYLDHLVLELPIRSAFDPIFVPTSDLSLKFQELARVAFTSTISRSFFFCYTPKFSDPAINRGPGHLILFT